MCAPTATARTWRLSPAQVKTLQLSDSNSQSGGMLACAVCPDRCGFPLMWTGPQPVHQVLEIVGGCRAGASCVCSRAVRQHPAAAADGASGGLRGRNADLESRLPPGESRIIPKLAAVPLPQVCTPRWQFLSPSNRSVKVVASKHLFLSAHGSYI